RRYRHSIRGSSDGLLHCGASFRNARGPRGPPERSVLLKRDHQLAVSSPADSFSMISASSPSAWLAHCLAHTVLTANYISGLLCAARTTVWATGPRFLCAHYFPTKREQKGDQ